MCLVTSETQRSLPQSSHKIFQHGNHLTTNTGDLYVYGDGALLRTEVFRREWLCLAFVSWESGYDLQVRLYLG